METYENIDAINFSVHDGEKTRYNAGTSEKNIRFSGGFNIFISRL